jgi:hypothetical protein
MDYTQSDVDRILEASRKASPGPWSIEPYCEDALIIDAKGELIETVYTCEANAIMFSGALILAEEVKRLKAENETLKAELTNWPIDYPPDDMV